MHCSLVVARSLGGIMISPVSAVGYPKGIEVSAEEYRKLLRDVRKEIVNVTSNNNTINIEFTFFNKSECSNSTRYIFVVSYFQ